MEYCKYQNILRIFVNGRIPGAAIGTCGAFSKSFSRFAHARRRYEQRGRGNRVAASPVWAFPLPPSLATGATESQGQEQAGVFVFLFFFTERE